MKIGSGDLAAVGLCLAIAGTFLLAKSIISKDISMIDKETGTYYGQNIFQLKSAIFQKHESITGGLYLILGFLCNLVSIFIAQKNGAKNNILLYSYWNTIFFIIVSILLIWVGYSVARKISLNKYFPIVKTSERISVLNKFLFVLEHDGWYPEEYERREELNLNSNDFRSRIEQAERIFVNFGLFLDIKKQPDESYIEFANRVIEEYSKK